MGADNVTRAIRSPIRWLRVKLSGLAAPSGERGELVSRCHVHSLLVAILNNECRMSLCPPGSVSMVPLLQACHPAQHRGDTVSKCTLMSVQGKTTVKMSEAGGCVCSVSLH